MWIRPNSLFLNPRIYRHHVWWPTSMFLHNTAMTRKSHVTFSSHIFPISPPTVFFSHKNQSKSVLHLINRLYQIDQPFIATQWETYYTYDLPLPISQDLLYQAHHAQWSAGTVASLHMQDGEQPTNYSLMISKTIPSWFLDLYTTIRYVNNWFFLRGCIDTELNNLKCTITFLSDREPLWQIVCVRYKQKRGKATLHA